MGGGDPTHASAFCSACGNEMRGAWGVHTCTECGTHICAFCARRFGGFLGFGGREVCPNCYRYLTKK